MSAAKPPVMWTTPEPAKSIIPTICSAPSPSVKRPIAFGPHAHRKPFESHTQCTTTG